MKGFLIALLVLLKCTAGAAYSGRSRLQHRQETLEVMHCLKSGDMEWLANSQALTNAKTFVVGLVHDRTSYEYHWDHIVVVVFENRTRGDVFDLTHEDQGNHRTYRIENNGEFRLGHAEVEWPGEILGGNWTHDYIERNIRRVMRRPKIRVQLKKLPRPFPQVTCTSYVSDR